MKYLIKVSSPEYSEPHYVDMFRVGGGIQMSIREIDAAAFPRLDGHIEDIVSRVFDRYGDDAKVSIEVVLK